MELLLELYCCCSETDEHRLPKYNQNLNGHNSCVIPILYQLFWPEKKKMIIPNKTDPNFINNNYYYYDYTILKRVICLW